jgi:hypothetical protein
MDSGAAQEEVIKKMKNTISPYEKVVDDQEKRIREPQVSNSFIL